MKPRYTPFAKGDQLGKLVILEVVEPGRNQYTALYIALFPCCGETKEINGRNARRWETGVTTRCKGCRGKAFKEEVSEKSPNNKPKVRPIVLTGTARWPVPPSILGRSQRRTKR